MKRILACLATLMLIAAGAAAQAQTYDPIGDIVAAVRESAIENATNWGLKATIYHGGNGMNTRDSLGCPVSPLRTVAIDRAVVSRGAILFIKETKGMPLPGGGVHDGYWYASDTGTGIVGQRIDLFSGPDEASMGPLWPYNLKVLTVEKVGEFNGCPPVDGGRSPTILTRADPPGPAEALRLHESPLEHEIAGVRHSAFVKAAPDQQSLQVGQDGGAATQH